MKFNYYHILNTVNNKEYIGITEKPLEQRFSQHKKSLKAKKHPNWLLTEDWEKYGEKSFVFEMIESLEFNSIEEGYEHELFLISNSNHELYNLAPGGQMNPMYSKEIRDKMTKTKQSVVPNIY